MISSVKIRKISKPFQTDLELWQDFRRGNLETFSEIYENHVQVLYNYGCKLTTDKTLVEDSIQDIFIEIWKSKENLSDTDNIKYYLFKCLRRKLSRKLKENDEIDYKLSAEIIGEVSPENELINLQQSQLQQARLHKAFQALTKRQKEVIFLKFYENLSFQEVASVMSLGMKSTYNLVAKALDVLRNNLHKVDVFWWVLLAGNFWF